MSTATRLSRSIKSRRGFARLLWLGTALVNIFVIAMVALVVKLNQERDVAQAVAQTENYCRILQEDLAGFFSKIDITLLTVSDEVSRQMASGGINPQALESFLARQDKHIPEALGLRVVDAQGFIRYAVNDVKVRNASIADRPQFIRLRDDAQAGLVISQPIFGRAAQKWMITLSRRINHPDGSFAGDVHVAVAVDHFIRLFAKIDLGPQGNIGLWGDTTLIARYTKRDTQGASVGVTTPSAELRQLIGAGQLPASYQARSGVDGIYRSFHVSRINDYPLYVVVGLAEEDYLADSRKDALRFTGLAALFLMTTCGAAALIYRGWRRREADHLTLLHQEADYTEKLEIAKRVAESAWQQSNLILTSAGEGICGVDQDGKVVFVNPAARQMFGWDENEGVGLDLHAQTHHHHADGRPFPHQDCPIFHTLADGQRRQIKNSLYWRKDGTAFPVEFTVTAMELNGQISGVVNVFRDITERKQLEEKITHLALHDCLTGLPNRSFLSDALHRTVAFATRHQECLGVLYVDLDGFKAVNDSMGHTAGDAVLRTVATRLSACLRTEDVVARLGGDEFLIITLAGQNDTQQNCITLAERIIDSIRRPIHLPEGVTQVGASIGIAIFLPGENTTIEMCIQKADAAMYKAKYAGKGRYGLSD